MRKEEDCLRESRYLSADVVFLSEGINMLKEETIRRYKSSAHKGWDKELLDKYLSWEKKESELALFTLYAYADLPIPTTFNCLFNIKNPQEYTISKLSITQSIYEGYYPSSTIDHGHKHLLICDFKDGVIPNITSKLFAGSTKHSSPPAGCFMLGICDFKNYPYILSNLTEKLCL